MGSDPKELITAVLRALREMPRARRISVAFSGGPDSSVLLEALVRLRDADDSGLPALRALHVNHGLQEQARDWVQQCESYCRSRRVELTVLSVSVPRRAAESLEDAARKSRYQALGQCLEDGEILCTAQHANDQAETLLLQLLRGAGPRGLAAMPVIRRFHAGYLARPLLTVSQDFIMHCIRCWDLPLVTDPANSDPRFARTRVRRLLLENILPQFPGAVTTLNRSARLQAAASNAIETLAGLDIQDCRGSIPTTLAAGALAGLPHARGLEVLRCWLREQDLPIPNQARLLEVSRQMATAGADRQPVIRWPGVEVRRYRNQIHALRPVENPNQDWCQIWRLERKLRLPWGCLWSEPAIGRGLKLDCAQVDVRLRQGGERCRPAGHRNSRRLKHLLQENHVPPWQRGRWPLLQTADGLAAVAGLWVCEGFQARAGEPGRVIHWQPA